MKISALLSAAWLLISVNVASAQWKLAASPLVTKWAKDVSPKNALPEYPRPQLVREQWQNLNGLWSYGVSDAAAATPPAMTGQILVPYPYESALSGVGKPSIPNERLWYKRAFTVPAAWRNESVLLHFGAVNYDSAVWLNGKQIGTHKGGYDAFDFDITQYLRPGPNDLVVSAMNPMKTDVPDAQVLGKQRVRPEGIFYTGATGIWQTVWIEPVPTAHIESVRLVPDVDAGVLRATVMSAGTADVGITVSDGGKTVIFVGGKPNTEIVLPIRQPKLWTPDHPHLYDVEIQLGKDFANAYFGMRKIAIGRDDMGRNRIFLNNQFLFQVGALDQGYWPDGIYTAPTDAALRSDIEFAKRINWNLLRKHAKVEPARWYYWCDKLGMLVWQDMPQMFGSRNGDVSESARTQFDAEWKSIIAQHINCPSIVVWTTFNEGWGQHDTEAVVARTKAMDPSRLVNNASGWTDKDCGDIHDAHAYPGPGSPEPDETRAAVNGEYGGITVNAGHRWNDRVMGYGSTLRSSWIATKRYQDLLRKGYALRDDRGCSALVYTQITDCEQEINGLMTYDRALVKMDEKIIRAANAGSFLPLGPNPDPELVPTSDFEPVAWNYTEQKPAEDWGAATFDATSWKTGNAPFGHDYGPVGTDWRTSDLWIRRHFTLGRIPAKVNLVIKHDEDAEVYINGVLAAKVAGFTGEYKLVPLPTDARAALKSGDNTMAIHVHQTIGGQGIDAGLAEAK